MENLMDKKMKNEMENEMASGFIQGFMIPNDWVAVRDLQGSYHNRVYGIL